RDLDERRAATLVAARGALHLVALSQPVLSHEVRRNIGIAVVGEVAGLRAADEAPVARRIEPPGGFPCRDELRRLRHAARRTLAWHILPRLAATAAAVSPPSAAVLVVISWMAGESTLGA